MSVYVLLVVVCDLIDEQRIQIKITLKSLRIRNYLPGASIWFLHWFYGVLIACLVYNVACVPSVPANVYLRASKPTVINKIVKYISYLNSGNLLKQHAQKLLAGSKV